eukprot:scaffold10039_cov67-Skeletonema_dohrnii-CCMP3373.AAC.1
MLQHLICRRVGRTEILSFMKMRAHRLALFQRILPFRPSYAYHIEIISKGKQSASQASSSLERGGIKIAYF